MERTQLLWLIYKRFRNAFGVTLGFILMYSFYINQFSAALILFILGFFSIHMFGEFYNDYCDFEEDLRNERNDKFTIYNILTPNQMKLISFFLLSLGLIILYFTNFMVFLFGLYFTFIYWSYSNPNVRLKKYNIFAYILGGTVCLFFPIFINLLLQRGYLISDFIFTLFCFTQLIYLLCQKDSTDLKDKANLFLKWGWRRASLISIVFASLSSFFLLIISLNPIELVLIWGMNFLSKVINLRSIFSKKIGRKLRENAILIEFLTPYLWIGGMM